MGQLKSCSSSPLEGASRVSADFRFRPRGINAHSLQRQG